MLKVQPGNREAQQQLNAVNSRIKHHVAKERVIFGKFLPGATCPLRENFMPVVRSFTDLPRSVNELKSSEKKRNTRQPGSRVSHVVSSDDNIKHRIEAIQLKWSGVS